MSIKYAMVLNLDRCIGCMSCVAACKMAYGTRPGINYNGVKIIEWEKDSSSYQRYMLTMCMHCDDPACVKVCPADATFKNDNGIVQIDYDKCIGCGYCKSACPYDQRHIVRDNDTSYEGAVAPYEEQSYGRINVAEKCTFCAERVETGQAPMCTVHCPGQCRIFGDVNDPESAVSMYIKTNSATQIEGTNIYYVLSKGMDRAMLPAAYQEPLYVSAKQGGTAVGKALVGVAAVAVVGGLIGNATNGGKKDDK